MFSSEIPEFLHSCMRVTLLGPIFILISSFAPAARILLASLWLAGVALDGFTTLRFYRLDPVGFTKLERNIILTSFVEKLGFAKGLMSFILFFEVPVTVLLGITLLPMMQTYLMSVTNPDFMACIPASFSIIGVEHAQAARKNNSIYKRMRCEARQGDLNV
jgi:hypothetical protein